ncbi:MULTISPECIES: rod shape-determining protein RodA [Kangiella]|uniref:Peptidoglycan glycosyltransferase MrdB n=2 Tax=Kangiella TaxID=261963 RepID=A0A318D9E4_9GAMM|nr:rod shape-determining protein RodA [Kangiella spongicola]MBV35285.1 rod shape-determining protein RodA [Rickettsiales bacterium]PXF64555.1 rod shape-determining protein RodA [Kangiella spongicola]
MALRTSAANTHKARSSLLWRLHIDVPLLFGLCALMGFSLLVVYSAGGESLALVEKQLVRFGAGMVVMLMLAQVSPRTLKEWAPLFFVVGIGFLLAVLFFGESSKGAQRWIDIGVRFQPSEIMKLAVPIMVAAFLADKALPPSFKHLVISLALVLTPTVLIMIQPDLGTSLLIAASGFFVIFFAGLRWKYIVSALGIAAILAPIMWYFTMEEYQKGRVLTFLNPESDPLGSGYHIIQSQIAIGSGGLYGKGWLNGTQSQLEFLPERHTDFIFAVLGEEFGLIGIIILLAIYLFVIWRGLYISLQGQDSFSRLLGAALTLTFFVYLFVNIGMVSGLLPVVGLPLPLISYGGTSIVTLMASFGILMSIQTHRRLHSA